MVRRIKSLYNLRNYYGVFRDKSVGGEWEKCRAKCDSRGAFTGWNESFVVVTVEVSPPHTLRTRVYGPRTPVPIRQRHVSGQRVQDRCGAAHAMVHAMS